MSPSTRTRATFLPATAAACLIGVAAAGPPKDCEPQHLIASQPGDEFGLVVSISGDAAIIGSWFFDKIGFNSGSATVFRFDGVEWVLEQVLTADDAAPQDWFGATAAIDGDVVVVGAPGDDHDSGENAGSAYVFRFDGDAWALDAKLTADDGGPDDRFGFAVGLSGEQVIVGARAHDSEASDAGAAYVFGPVEGSWIQQQKLIATDPGADEWFGAAVAMDGDTAVIGARRDDENGVGAGAAYVYRLIDGAWAPEQKLLADDGEPADEFAFTVALDDNVIGIGAWADGDLGNLAGSAYIFRRDNAVWTQEQKLLASDGGPGDRYGVAVAIEGGTAIVGAWFADHIGNNSGAAYLYRRTAGTWVEEGKLLAPPVEGDDWYGASAALDNDIAFIGARADDAPGIDSGSVYVFDLLCGVCPGDIDGSGTVDVEDLVSVILAWGESGGPADLNGDGLVDVQDLIAVILAWGACGD